MQEINKKGWLSKEPLDDKIKANAPKMLKNIAKNTNKLVEVLLEANIDMYSKDIEVLLGL